MALYRALGPPVAEASTAPGRRTQIELAVSIAWRWPIVVAGSIELAVCAAVASRWPIVVAGRWPVVRRVALASATAAIESRAAGAASCSGNERGEGSAS